MKCSSDWSRILYLLHTRLVLSRITDLLPSPKDIHSMDSCSNLATLCAKWYLSNCNENTQWLRLNSSQPLLIPALIIHETCSVTVVHWPVVIWVEITKSGWPQGYHWLPRVGLLRNGTWGLEKPPSHPNFQERKKTVGSCRGITLLSHYPKNMWIINLKLRRQVENELR